MRPIVGVPIRIRKWWRSKGMALKILSHQGFLLKIEIKKGFKTYLLRGMSFLTMSRFSSVDIIQLTRVRK